MNTNCLMVFNIENDSAKIKNLFKTSKKWEAESFS